jgi:hypothetical protein
MRSSASNSLISPDFHDGLNVREQPFVFPGAAQPEALQQVPSRASMSEKVSAGNGS